MEYARRGRITEFIGHNEAVSTLLITPNEQYLVSSSMDNTIKIWDISQGIDIGLPADLQLTVVPGHTDNVNALAFQPMVCGLFRHRVMAAERCGVVRPHLAPGPVSLPLPGSEMQIGRELFTLKCPDGGLFGLSISEDGRFMATAGQGIRVWSLENGAEIYALDSTERTYAYP